MTRAVFGENMSRSNGYRVWAMACAMFLIFVAFQAFDARASLPNTGSGEYNHALARNGGVAAASTSYGTFVPTNAIDGSTSTYWQANDRTGWLAVKFQSRAFISEVHVHFLSVVYPAISLYFDKDGNGAYDFGEKMWSTTANKALDVVVGTATTETSGMKVAIDAKVGSKLPKIAEFEAYLRYDTDGDGLTNFQEADVTYYEDIPAANVPQKIPNVGVDTVLYYNMGTTTADGRMYDLSGRGNDATLVGTSGYTFDGIDDYMETPDSISLDITGDLTISMQVYLSADPNCDGRNNSRVLLSKYSSAGSSLGPYAIFLEENREPSFAILSGGTIRRYIPTVYPIPIRAWTSIAFTYSAAFGTMFYHVNGNRVDMKWFGSGAVDVSTGPLRIGGGTSVGCPDGNGFFPGSIDEVQIWDRELNSLEIVSLGFKRPPTLFYDMETFSSPSVLQDLAGNSNLGTVVGTTPVEGRRGSALQFDGVSDYVRVANPMGGFPRSSLTLTAWVKRSGAGVIFDEQGWGAPDSAWHDSQMEILPDGTVRMGIWPRTATLTCGTIDTNWHHLALTYDSYGGGALTCYVDGVVRDSKTTSRDSSGATTYVIGKADSTNLGHGGSFAGIIDEVQIWYEALPAARVRDSYVIDSMHRSVDVSLAQFDGIPVRALANFTVDHPKRPDLTASIGYWDGTAWIDRYVWDPGGRVPMFQTGSGGTKVPGMATPPAAPVLGTLTSEWPVGEFDLETRSTIIVDLVAPQASATASENASRVLRPEFPIATFMTNTRWRLIVQEWTASGAGDVTAFTLRFETKTDPSLQDTDADGLSDYDERARILTLPVAADSDLDGLGDGYEVQPHDLTVTIDGVSSLFIGLTTDPRNGDTDGDGLSDGQERGVVSVGAITNPRLADTDGDSLPDGAEIYTYRTNPAMRDSDGDTIPDNVELVPSALPLWVNGGTQTRTITTSPSKGDTDGDGLRDDQEKTGTTPWGVVTDPTDADTDDDGLGDGSEAYVREFSLDGRVPLGTGGSRTVYAVAQGPIELVEVRFATSGTDVSSLEIRIDHAGVTGPYVWYRSGSGPYLHASTDITNAFAGLAKTGSYTLVVWGPAGGVVLEEFSILFKIRTNAVQADTDADGLGDREEIESGQDGWVTDPNAADTDGDSWPDSYEIQTRGTNPLLADTDGDGVSDPSDLDPTHNLLLSVTVYRVHHGSPSSTPTLQAVVHTNYNAAIDKWDYIYATPRVTATEDWKCLATYFDIWSWSWKCSSWGYTTSAFYATYYVDVPDDQQSANVKVQGWSYNADRNDDLLVESSVSHPLSSIATAVAAWNGDNKIWYTVSTVRLDKVRTLMVTDGQLSAQAADGWECASWYRDPSTSSWTCYSWTAAPGAVRFSNDQRFQVFLLRASSSAGAIQAGVNAILVPEALFAHTYLKARIDGRQASPLDETMFYDGDPSQPRMSEGIVGIVAGDLTGDDAAQVLAWLLQDESGRTVYQVIDITRQALVANLPGDVVQIVPWVAVVNSATGPMPEGNFFAKVWNALVLLGQLIYGGLVTLFEFFSQLGEAIVSWGMKALGRISEAINKTREAMQKAAEILQKAWDWAVDWVTRFIHTLVGPLVDKLRSMLDSWIGGVFDAAMDGFRRLREGGSLDLRTTVGRVLDAAMSGVMAIVAILTTAQVIEIALAYTLGVGVAVGAIASEVFKAVVIAAFTSAAVIGTVAVVNEIENGREDPQGVYGDFADVAAFAEISEAAFGFVGSLWELQNAKIPLLKRAAGVAFSLLGLGLTLYGAAHNLTGFALLVADVIGIAIATGGLILTLKIAAIDTVLSTLSRFVSFLEGILSVVGTVGAFLNVAGHKAEGKY